MFSWVLIAAISNPWMLQTHPTKGASEAIGGYTAGCLAAGVALPQIGSGFQILRPKEKRFYAHPIMRQYVYDLARQAQKMGLPDILVGDIAMSRGGPFPTGHRSHQTGLDADFGSDLQHKDYRHSNVTASNQPIWSILIKMLSMNHLARCK